MNIFTIFLVLMRKHICRYNNMAISVVKFVSRLYRISKIFRMSQNLRKWGKFLICDVSVIFCDFKSVLQKIQDIISGYLIFCDLKEVAKIRSSQKLLDIRQILKIYYYFCYSNITSFDIPQFQQQTLASNLTAAAQSMATFSVVMPFLIICSHMRFNEASQ